MTHTIGQKLDLNISYSDEDGCGVAELQAPADGASLVVVVPGAFPNEQVRARIVARSRHHPRMFGQLVEVLQPSPSRRDPPCTAHSAAGGRCDGCALMALSPPAQRQVHLQRLRSLGLTVERIEFLDDPLSEDGGALSYRHAAKRLAFADGRGRLRLGSWRRGGTGCAPMAGCLVDHPKIRSTFEHIEKVAGALGVSPGRSAQEGGGGDLCAVWAMTDGDAVLVSLLVRGEDSTAARELPVLVPGVDGWARAIAGQGNDLRGGDWQPLRGLQALPLAVDGANAPGAEPLPAGLAATAASGTEPGAALTISVPNGAFLQPNPVMARRAWAALVADYSGAPLPAMDFAVDLFAGAGATTALLRRIASEVLPVEAAPAAAAALGVPPRRALDAVQALCAEGRTPALIVANPPRAGLGPALCDAIVALGPRRLHLMSCNPMTLRQDLDSLPGYQLLGLRAFDTLPQTAHVEVVAHLARVEDGFAA